VCAVRGGERGGISVLSGGGERGGLVCCQGGGEDAFQFKGLHLMIVMV